ncbi:unnamed protein product [Ectocarpus sp. CCAP 1310/34]|nr:unnamed protein product [Ectocarpus sp. CCAP 1310/34]
MRNKCSTTAPELLKAQGKYDDAEQLYERSLAIREKVLGPEHPDVAQSLNNRELLRAQISVVLNNRGGVIGDSGESQAVLLEASRKTMSLHRFTTLVLQHDPITLSTPFHGKYFETEPLYGRSTAIWEKR